MTAVKAHTLDENTEARPLKPQILVVDDEVAMVRSLELLLRPLGQVIKAYSVPEALEVVSKENRVDCIVTDVSMPEASGLDLVDHIRRKAIDIPVVVMTAYSSVPQAVEAIQRGAFEYLVKPFENLEMVDIVRKAISKKGLSYGETKALPGWICNSRAMKDFVAKAERLIQSPTLLILGEVGVGRNRAARWFHELSSRNKKEFLAIDGRTHDEDSPLLSKPLSRVGTLFVAEIFSLSERLQNKLMELIQEGKTSVYGSCSAAPQLQSVPNFRSDLFEKITALSIRVPSLKEREEDFEALTREILQNLIRRHNWKSLTLSPEALEVLKEIPFPGNVQELERVLERAALEARAGIITDENITQSGSELDKLLPFSIPVENGWNRMELLRQALERELIVRALEKYPELSNTQIAMMLGTTRRVLELRMKDYSIRETS